MNRNIKCLFSVLLICCLFLSGCIFVVAGVGALGGYAISKDTIQGETEKTYDKVWNTAKSVLNTMGSVITENKSKGEFEADFSPSFVKVKIEELTPKTTRLRVSARKYMFPNINLAQKIYIKIIEQAK
ncbi:MAG: DUF3568 family protein [Candidatus Omnitrophota bacterium]